MATCLRWGGIFNNSFVANLQESVTVKEFWKSDSLTKLCVDYVGLLILAHPVKTSKWIPSTLPHVETREQIEPYTAGGVGGARLRVGLSGTALRRARGARRGLQWGSDPRVELRTSGASKKYANSYICRLVNVLIVSVALLLLLLQAGLLGHGQWIKNNETEILYENYRIFVVWIVYPQIIITNIINSNRLRQITSLP